MNLILIHPEEIQPGCDGRVASATLRGRRARHVREVLRAEAGRDLRAGVLGGSLGSARVVEGAECDAAAAGEAEAVLLQLTLADAPPPPLALRLVLALPRPKVLARVLVDATAAGVKEIDLIGAWRVEKSYWQSPVLDARRTRDYLIAGLEQGGDTVLPQLRTHRLFKPFVEDVLPGLAAGTTALVAHPRAEPACPHAVAGTVTLIVGPERGFTDYEIDKLAAAGARAVTLGARALRVEAAVAALIGRLC